MVLSIDQWVGKLAVVTGASAGIGAATSKKLVECGVNVVGLARRENKIQEIANTLKGCKAKLYAFKCDVTNEEEVKRVFYEIATNIGPVHILINSAGVTMVHNVTEGNVDDWRKILDTNVIGTCIPSREAIKIMTANQIDGQIININSILGHHVYPIPSINIYIASKHALTALTESLRLELIGMGSKIKITSLSPGPVDETDFFIKSTIGPDGNGPLMHFLKPNDLAEAVLFILSTAPHCHVGELMLRPVGEPL